MRNKRNIVFVLIVVLLSTLILSACMGENSTVNVSAYSTNDALSLFLTGTVKGYLNKTSNFLYISLGIKETYEKLQKPDLRRAVSIAYILANELDYVVKQSSFSLAIVFVDCYQDGQIKGLWVARQDWIQASPKAFDAFIEGLAQSADYRASHYVKSIGQAKAELGNEYQIKNYGDVGYYLAAYSKDNNEKIDENPFESKSAKQTLSHFAGFAEKQGEGYGACLALYNQALDNQQGASNSFDDVFKLDKMLQKTELLAS